MLRGCACVLPRVHRRACLLTLLAAGCDRAARIADGPTAAPVVPPAPYRALRRRIAELRDEHAERLSTADDEATRSAVMADAKRELSSAIADVLLPAWLGTRWSFHGTADEPHAPEGIACGYFVAAVLQHASLELESRRRFAQSTARTIARSLIPPGSAHHRIFSVPAAVLDRALSTFGDGLYLIGLDVHVGFIHVQGGAARMIHASYLGTRTVVSEPVTACEAIEHSRSAGYHVTALFADDTLVDAWLARRTIALRASSL